MALLKSGHVKSLAGGGYLSHNNFSLNDLSDKLLKDLAEANPALIQAQLKRPGDQYQALDRARLKRLGILKDEKAEKAGKAQPDDGDLEGDLAA